MTPSEYSSAIFFFDINTCRSKQELQRHISRAFFVATLTAWTVGNVAQAQNNEIITKEASRQRLVQLQLQERQKIENLRNRLLPSSLRPDYSRKSNKAFVEEEPRTVRHVIFGRDILVSYPIFFTARTADGKNLILSGTESGSATLLNHQQDTSAAAGWYNRFIVELSKVFVAKKPGGIHALVRINRYGLEKVDFEAYRQAWMRDPKPSLVEHTLNEFLFKQSVQEALASVAKRPELKLPAGLESVSIRLGFAGNVPGKSFGLDTL